MIGFDRWCWPLADPETLLPLSGVAEHDFGPRLPRSLELEYSDDHFAAKHVLGRRANSAGSLSVETGGDLALSTRWDEVMRPAGIGDIAAVACRDALGCWGWIEAYRDGADRRFEAGDLELLANVGPSLGSALRRGFTVASQGDALEPSPPGVKPRVFLRGVREPCSAIECPARVLGRRESGGSFACPAEPVARLCLDDVGVVGCRVGGVRVEVVRGDHLRDASGGVGFPSSGAMATGCTRSIRGPLVALHMNDDERFKAWVEA